MLLNALQRFSRLSLICIGGFLVLLHIFWLPDQDEALQLVQSKWMLQGQLPYQDFFQFTLPGIFYWGLATFKLTGIPSVIAARLSMIGLLIIGFLVLNRLSKRYLSRPWRFWLWLFWLLVILSNFPVFSHHVLSGMLGTLSFCMLALFIEQASSCKEDETKKSKKSVVLHYAKLGLSGILAIACFFTTQSLGILVIGASVSLLLIWTVQTVRLQSTHQAWVKGLFSSACCRFLFIYCIILFISLLLACLPLYFSGVLGQCVTDCFGWLSSGHYSETTLLGYNTVGFTAFIKSALISPTASNLHWLGYRWAAINFSGLWSALTGLIVAWLPVLGILWAIQGRLLRKENRWKIDAQAVLVCGAVAMAFSTFSYSTLFHIGVTGYLGDVLGLLALQDIWKNFSTSTNDFFSTRLKIALPLLGLLLLLAGSGYELLNHWALFQEPGRWVSAYGWREKKLMGFHMSNRVFATEVATALIQKTTRSADPIFIFNASPVLYLLGDRRQATRFTVIYPVYTSTTQLNEILRDLKAHPPKMMIDDHKEAGMLAKDPRFNRAKSSRQRFALKPLHHWIKYHYAFLQLDNDFTFLQFRK